MSIKYHSWVQKIMISIQTKSKTIDDYIVEYIHMSYYIGCVCYFLILGNKCRVPTSTPMAININVRLPSAHLPQVPTSLKLTLQPLCN